MKAIKTTTALLLIFVTLPLWGQNPLVGTWQRSNDTLRSVKIITPTHWMVFVETRKGEIPTFAVCAGGTYTLTGNKYIEQINIASWEDYGRDKTDFTFRAEGDKFYQVGTLTLGNGQVVPIDEVWQKVSPAHATTKSPAVGTWNQLTATYTGADGKTQSFTPATATTLEIVTPTHWMALSLRGNKFDHAFGGSYTMTGNKVYPVVEYASFPLDKTHRYEVTQKISRGKRYSRGMVSSADGQAVMTFESVFQKVNGNKLVSVTVK